MLVARKLSVTLALAASLMVLLVASEGAAASDPPTTAVTDRPSPPAKVQRQARTALRVARRARKIGRRAVAQSNIALAAADEANARLDAGQVASDTDAASVTTAEENAYQDLGGPSVTVDVPASGMVELWATVTFGTPNDGLVGLFEDGQAVPMDQAGICGSTTIDDALLAMGADTGDPITLSTPPAVLFGIGCGSPGSVPGEMLVQSSPGTHTFELRYADCGCDPGDATFSDRTLRVAGRE